MLLIDAAGMKEEDMRLMSVTADALIRLQLRSMSVNVSVCMVTD